MALALLKKLFKKSPQHTDYEKLPPPSLGAKSSETVVLKNLDTGTRTSKKPTSAENKNNNKHDIKTCSVQICPHETLSFKRMKRIIHLPNFEYGRVKVGAFTKAPSHHHVPSSAGTYRCKPYPKTFSCLKAKGYYKYERGFPREYAGLMLCVDWSMNFDAHKKFTGSVSELQRLLNVLDIHLCQHITMSELTIAEDLFRFCNPSGVEGDPVVAYEEAHRTHDPKQCTRCHTVFETYQEGKACHILVKRYLGLGTSIYEGRWLAHCGEEKHRLRSFGVAALQICTD